MKKIIYFSLLLFVCKMNFAQNALAVKNAALKNKTVSVSNQVITEALNNPVSMPENNNTFYKMIGTRESGDIVGNTSYDLPTNNTPPNRLLVYNDGKVSAVWTGSTSSSSSRPDRGTFYNSFNGSSWSSVPIERIEDYRTGFPALISVGDHEMFFSHDGNNQIAIFENSAPGANDWTENSNSLQIYGTWPRAACAEGSNYIHLLVANDDPSNKNDYMIYYRSSDGGETWDIHGLRLPGIDTVSGTSIMGAECYTILAKENNVYIAAGSKINDLTVWKSSENGDVGSWTKTRIIEWPIPNYDGNIISDYTGDGVADTIVNHDGSLTLAVDNDGMMHVLSGVTYVLDVTEGDAAWTYFPGVAGMFYWNESFGADSIQYLEFPLVDWDDDGDPYLGIGADLPNYGCGFTSQPSMSVDESTGKIYVAYSHPVEYTDFEDNPDAEDAESFRDLFGFYSSDKGNTWSTPINLTYTAKDYNENINPSLFYKVMDNKIHSLWMEDNNPGNSLETELPDPITLDNNILYRAFDLNRFDPYDPTADYAFITDANNITYNNLSVDADSYLWDLGDGNLSNIENPAHVYDAIGSYEVCLTATNKYGTNTVCKTVDIIEVVNINDQNLQNNITVYPTLASNYIMISIQNICTDISVEIYSLEGKKLQTTLLNSENKLDISNFPSGSYILKFITNNSIITKKFVKQ